MAAVFSDLGKMPDASELLTSCMISLSTEVKTVFKKSDGIMFRVQVIDFRCRTVSSRIFKSLGQIKDKLLCLNLPYVEKSQ